MKHSRVRRFIQQQAGWTLVELVVGLALFGLTAGATVYVLTSARDSGTDAANVAKQNSLLRNTMQSLRKEIGQADRPLPTTQQWPKTFVAGEELWTDDLVIYRTTQVAGGGEQCRAYRFAYHGSGDANPELRNSLVMYIANSCGAPVDWSSAAKKILLDGVVEPTESKPLFRLLKDASTPTRWDNTNQWRNNVSLIEVTLQRDQDLVTGDNSDDKYPPAEMSSTIYLEKMARHTQSSASPGGC